MGEAPSDPETFRALWRGAVAEYADRPAVRDDERVLSYRELDRLQDAIGAAFHGHPPAERPCKPAGRRPCREAYRRWRGCDSARRTGPPGALLLPRLE